MNIEICRFGSSRCRSPATDPCKHAVGVSNVTVRERQHPPFGTARSKTVRLDRDDPLDPGLQRQRGASKLPWDKFTRPSADGTARTLQDRTLQDA